MLVHRFDGSSAISSLRYNPETGQMDVTFLSGRTYTHEGVPPDVVESFVSAASPGRYYANSIKGVY